MTQPLPVITQPPPGFTGRVRYHLRNRRFAMAGGLAVAEVLYLLIAGPGWFLSTLLALAVLVGAVAALSRVPRGIASDALVVVAIAQGFVLMIPLLLGFSIAVGVMVGAGLVVLLVLAALGARRS